MLLTENPAFDTILTAIPRMISMLTGEFNFENLFYTDGVRVQGTTMAKIIFTAFVFIVHICVMNILVRDLSSNLTKNNERRFSFLDRFSCRKCS